MRYLSIFLLFFYINSFCQTKKIDSLKIELQKKPESLAVLLMLADEYIYSIQDSSKFYSLKALALSKSNNDMIAYAKALNRLGSFYINSYEIDSAKSCFEQAINIREIENDHLLKAKILSNLGQAVYFSGHFKKELEVLAEAEMQLEMAKDGADKKKQRITILYLKSSAFYGLGLYHESLKVLFENKKVLDESKDPRALSNCCNSLGLTYQQLGENEKSLSYFKMASFLGTEAKDNVNLPKYLDNIASSYLLLNKLDSARFYCEKSKNFYIDNGREAETGKPTEIEGSIFFKEGKYTKAINSFTNSINTFKNAGGEDMSFGVYLLRGAVYDSMKNYLSAFNDYQFALSGFKSINEDYQIMMCNYQLANLKYKTKEYKTAIEFFKAYDELRDSMVNKQRIETISQQEIKYETSLKETTIAKQQLEIKSQKQKNLWLITASGVTAMGALIFGLLYGRIRKQKLQIENQKLEILHNNRNNIQQLISIFNRQADTKELKESSLANQERLYTLNVLNKLLYEKGDNNQADVKEFITQLSVAKEISSGKTVKINVAIPSIKLKSNLLKDIGLIVNELTTNAIKYAFQNTTDPLIEIQLTSDDKKSLTLQISDNGKGLPDGFSLGNARNSFGLEFVNDLVAQHHGTVEVYNKNGTCFIIYLKMR